MNTTLTPLVLDAAGWVQLATYFMSLSLLSIGGVMATAPDMYRYMVDEHAWIYPMDFSTSISIAQAAPGPNILFVALLGWNVGLQAAGPELNWLSGMIAVTCSVVCLMAMLLPSSILVWSTTRWMRNNSHRRSIRAIRLGMGPLVVGLIIATGWILVARISGAVYVWAPWVLAAITTVLVWKTKMHLLWMLLVGAALGAFGWV